MPPRRIALLMESWLSVGPGYNVHYIYLSPWVCGPARIPTGGSSPTAEHKAVKRFNSIRAAERAGCAGVGWRRQRRRAGFIEFNASAVSALWKSPRCGLHARATSAFPTHPLTPRHTLPPCSLPRLAPFASFRKCVVDRSRLTAGYARSTRNHDCSRVERLFSVFLGGKFRS